MSDYLKKIYKEISDSNDKKVDSFKKFLDDLEKKSIEKKEVSKANIKITNKTI